MDFDKYFKKDSDGYTLHFVNKGKLSVFEIQKIFSVYGIVLAINTTKEEAGFRFVKYRSLQETITCIKGLQDGSKIQLLPEKSKMKDRRINRKDLNDENLSNSRGNVPHKTFNGNDRSDNILDTSQNSMYNHKSIPNVTKDNSSVIPSLLSSKHQTSMEHNSLDTMDYAKYYKTTKEGGFSVHFANKKGLSSEYIQNTFSSYGTVICIYDGGHQNGLKIITYKTLDEVISCIKGLQNDAMISLLPQKDKLVGETRTTNQNGSNQWQTAKTEETSQKMFSTDKQFNSNSTHNEDNEQEKFFEYREKPIYNTKTSDRNKFDRADNFSVSARNLRHDYKSNADEIKHKNTGPQVFDEIYSSSIQQKLINNEDSYQVMRKKQEETKLHSLMKIKTDSKIDKNRRFSTHDQKMPMLLSDVEIKPKEFDALSESSLSNDTWSSSKIVYIPMQEIIVANIHDNYGIHYILHLFEKYSPIAATVVEMTSITNIRYCYIYFKTIKDAVAVEEEFDNLNLFGKNLIVLRTSQLIDETTCK